MQAEARSTTNPSFPYYSTQNSEPPVRKVISDSWDKELVLAPLYNPQEVKLHRVTGEFNSVVQIAATYCLRHYSHTIGKPVVFTQLRGTQLSAALEDLKPNLTNPWWESFVPDWTREYRLQFNLEPVDLVFTKSNGVTITFRGQIAVMEQGLQPIVLQPTGHFPHPSNNAWSWMSSSLAHVAEIDLAVPEKAEFDQTLREALHLKPSPPFHTQFLVSNTFGEIEVSLSTTYKTTPHDEQKSVEMMLNLANSTTTVKVDGDDAELLYERFLKAKKSLLDSQLAPLPEIPITPTISLLGRNPANVPVDEIQTFNVNVFHVKSKNRQAVCIGFDVVAGCKGIASGVEHFIGYSDYGVIHDEYVVERVLHHKWNQGGFDRSLAISNKVSVRVKRNGNERDEDAMVFGRLQLKSLQAVALKPHPDLRTDVLVLDGEAEVITDSLELLADGTMLSPNDVDLGPPADTFWGVNLRPDLNVPLESDPELREFQSRAHADGLQHLSKPFANFPLDTPNAPKVQYSRTEAVLKRVFYLGQLQQVFA